MRVRAFGVTAFTWRDNACHTDDDVAAANADAVDRRLLSDCCDMLAGSTSCEDQSEARGFVNLWGLPSRVWAAREQRQG